MSDELTHDPVPVNAGGRTMRGFLPGIHMEADPGMGAGGGAPVEAAPDAGGSDNAAAAGDGGVVAEPAAVAPVPAPASATIDWTDPDVIQVVDSRAAAIFEAQMQPLLPLLEQVLGVGDPAAAGQPGAGGPLNPWDDGFGEGLDARFQSLEQKMEGWLQQLAQPLMADQQAKAVAEGEQRLQDVLADDIGRHGEFSSKPEVDREARHLVRTLADHIYDGLAGRFGGHDQVIRTGVGPRLSEAAMTQSAGLIRNLLAAERSAGAAIETNRLATLASAPGAEPAFAAGVQVVGDIRARNIDEGLRSVTARHADAIRNAGSQ
jgi:hypothetical protein